MSDRTSPTNQLVILVHGFGSKRFLMKPLERSIIQVGFATRRFGYLSLVGSIQQHALRLQELLDEVAAEYEQVHLVAHSMGSVVARCALATADNPAVRRVVLIAPPNRGAPLARLAGTLAKPLCPAISEVSSAAGSLTNSISTENRYQIGVIAARFDWLIPVSHTHLADESDHVCLNSTHNSLLIQHSAAQATVAFLKHGEFPAACHRAA